ncbi:hypothetical protein TUBRATIS_004730 [Tubulinosema ratisbonensis]|uniref:Uncharacterized protein n=1 Tax=Tubulinosema ratisbonensis TaxID=291195 RepID=A0A437APQ7_9MICR|nr:hypothetical protein TUBRATIS_004730 [Tubulinosema ratisbonensis]
MINKKFYKNLMNIFKNELIKCYNETPRLGKNINKVFLQIDKNKYNNPLLLITIPTLKGLSIFTKSCDTLINQVSVPFIDKIENLTDCLNYKWLEKFSTFFKNNPKETNFFQNVKESSFLKNELEKSISFIEKEFVPSLLCCITNIKKCKMNLREDHLQKLYNLKENLLNEVNRHNPVLSKVTCVDYRNIETNLKDNFLITECETQFCVSFYKSNSTRICKRYFNHKLILKFELEKENLNLEELFFESM